MVMQSLLWCFAALHFLIVWSDRFPTSRNSRKPFWQEFQENPGIADGGTRTSQAPAALRLPPVTAPQSRALPVTDELQQQMEPRTIRQNAIDGKRLPRSNSDAALRSIGEEKRVRLAPGSEDLGHPKAPMRPPTPGELRSDSQGGLRFSASTNLKESRGPMRPPTPATEDMTSAKDLRQAPQLAPLPLVLPERSSVVKRDRGRSRANSVTSVAADRSSYNEGLPRKQEELRQARIQLEPAWPDRRSSVVDRKPARARAGSVSSLTADRYNKEGIIRPRTAYNDDF
eukprot:TRINITY_DN65836_c0_g1_i1.p1 TRINITY_DN65836_c0_g1~~TRINITY_DN65836_c0_g1_i1.p1  ORF type:complete len:285 (+),score=31.33 TRINITY_DN65836_c0_g1_i1:52-906(+)